MGGMVGTTMIAPRPCRIDEWICPAQLPPKTFETVRRRMVLEHFKWDPQVGDVATLAPFPIVLPESVAAELSHLAEELSAETENAERELLTRPDLTRKLAIPRAITRVLLDESLPLTPTAARVIRFDFHPSTDGWRISEANSDVPGGYSESSHFPRLMAEHWPQYQVAGDPLAALADAISAQMFGGGTIALLASPGFMEDQQVIQCLAGAMNERKRTTCIGRPSQLDWHAGAAILRSGTDRLPLGLIIRFFQGEWLSRLPDRHCWPRLFRGSHTPVCNPGQAILTESKRFPFVWDELKTPLPHWRSLLPETCDPQTVDWLNEPEWLLKAALGNNGDDIADRRFQSRRDWRNTVWSVRFRPGQWAAQKRFTPLSIPTPIGDMYCCLGVYTVNGRACGIYGRMSAKPLIDYSAIDVAILIRKVDGVPG